MATDWHTIKVESAANESAANKDLSSEVRVRDLEGRVERLEEVLLRFMDIFMNHVHRTDSAHKRDPEFARGGGRATSPPFHYETQTQQGSRQASRQGSRFDKLRQDLVREANKRLGSEEEFTSKKESSRRI